MDMDKLKSRLMLSYNIFKIVPLLGILIALYVMNRNLIAAYIIAIVCIVGGYGQALILPLPLLRSAANEGPRRRTTPLSRV